jgi:hypothetical protein
MKMKYIRAAERRLPPAILVQGVQALQQWSAVAAERPGGSSSSAKAEPTIWPG